MSEYIDRLQSELAAVRAEMSAQLQNGQAYAIQGSHNKTGVSFESLKIRERDLKRQLMAAIRGPRPRTVEVPRYINE